MDRILIVTILAIFFISCAEDKGTDSSFSSINIGTDSTFDIITWNIENFPKQNSTVDYLIELIPIFDADIIALQEIESATDFQNLINSLNNYDGIVTNSASYNINLALLYSTDLEIDSTYEIFTDDWWSFPRSPLVVHVIWNGQDIYIINNHFKCCGDGIMNLDDLGDEETRRYTASNLLKEYIDTNLPNENVIVLGDLNDILTDAVANNVFQMIINDTENYLFADMEIAEGSSADWSYPTWPSHLDHILITNELFDELDNSDIQTIKIDEYLDGGWNEYDQNISDHRPVAIKFNFNSNINGDINGDGILNIQDIILIVTMVLEGDYSSVADMNEDGTINILDVVLVAFIILSPEP